MGSRKRDSIFISYSHQDRAIYAEVKQKLLDRRLGDRVRDDNDIRPSDKWDPRIQALMDAAAVAVVILSDHYFSRRGPGRDYILEKELPYLLEHYGRDELDLLLLYWSPSPYFAPEKPPGDIEPFDYEWNGEKRPPYDLQQIQAVVGNGRVALAGEQDRLDLLQELALNAKRRLNERLDKAPMPTEESEGEERQLLSVTLTLTAKGLSRVYQVAGQTLRANPPLIPVTQMGRLKPYAAYGTLPEDVRERLGGELYRLLFGPADAGVFPAIAEQAWEPDLHAQANTLSVAVRIHYAGPAEHDWLLGLPWNHTGFRGEALAEHCGWSFEVTPAGLDNRFGQSLSPEPPLLLLYDDGAEGAARHASQLSEYLDHAFGFAPNARSCVAMDQVAERVRGQPQPEVLYVYGPADLDLQRLARILGDEAAPLVVLNLVGEGAPAPPAELVRHRKLVVSAHGISESLLAREAGHRWLQGFLEGAADSAHPRIALRGFGIRARLWSGCSGLQIPLNKVERGVFRRQLIKLLLDRVSARREISDEVSTALNEDRGVLGLVAAGTPSDHPGLLPQQAWHHYVHVWQAAGGDAVRRLALSEAASPDPAELLYQLAIHLGSDVDRWEDAMDRYLGETGPGERVIMSLEWRVPQAPPETEPGEWRAQWLDAWRRFGTDTLAGYGRRGLLIVHMLLAEVPGADEADAWCKEAMAQYRDWRRAPGPGGRRFVFHELKPLSEVPVDDIERFLDVHYRLQTYYPELDPYRVAEWVHEQTGGVFSDTVDLVERLHDTGFREAIEALG